MKLQITPLKNFTEFQEEHSLAEQLPFWDFFQNYVALSDGTLIYGLKLKGLYIETSNENKINSLTLKLRSFLNGLEDGTEIGFIVNSHSCFSKILEDHRKLESKKKVLNKVSQDRLEFLKEEIKNQRILKKDIYLLIYKRHGEGFKKLNLFRSFFKAPQSFKSITTSQHKKREKEVMQLTSSLSTTLKNMGIKNKVLERDEIKGFIYEFFNPERSQTEPLPCDKRSGFFHKRT